MKKIESILFAIAKVAFASRPLTWAWLGRQTRSYVALLAAVLLAEIILIALGVMIPWRIFPVIMFLAAIAIMSLTYIPVGLAKTVLQAQGIDQSIDSLSGNIYPLELRRLFGWIAIAGLVGVIHNPFLNIWTVAIGIFLFFIFDAFGVKKTRTNSPLIITAVVLLTMWAAWSSVFPDSKATFVRYISSWGGIIDSEQHRTAVSNEADAAVTYCRLKEDINVAYIFSSDDDGSLVRPFKMIAVKVRKDSVIKLYDHESTVAVFEGQGFTRIQLPNKYGSFLGGSVYWVEADRLEILGPEKPKMVNSEPLANKISYMPDDDSPSVSYSPSQSQVVDLRFDNSGRYRLVGALEESGWITVGPCKSYYFSSGARITLYYQDGHKANSWEVAKWPDRATFRLKNWSQNNVDLIII